MIGKHWIWLLFAFVYLTSPTWSAWALEGVSPRLSDTLLTAPAERFVRVNAILNDQLQLQELLKLVIDKPRRQWRKITVPLMIDHADKTQARLRHDLNLMEKSGDARNIKLIWLCNAINFEAKVGSLNGFFQRYPELRSLDLDPDIPVEHLLDSGVNTTSLHTPPPHTNETNTTDWGLDDIQCHQVWAHGYWGQGVVIATIDTGVDTTHPALQNRIWHNRNETPNNGVDDDQNGYIDDTWGWNFDGNNNNPGPALPHGTNTAGIMVGATATDTVGVAPMAKLMVLRDVNAASSGGMSLFWLAQQYAVYNGADVISSSLSFKWIDDPPYATFRQATDMELAAGIIHANSIGNQWPDSVDYPRPYNIATPGNCPPPWLPPQQTLRGGISSIMGVGAYQSGHLIAYYSDHGPAEWDSIASRPTTNIPLIYRDYPYHNGASQGLLKPELVMPTDSRTTNTPSGYLTGFNGTSASTPHLGGALALMLSAEPDASPMNLCEALLMTADTTATNQQYNIYGAGRARIWNAIQYLFAHVRVGAVQGTIIDTVTNQPINHATLTLYSAIAHDANSDSTGAFLFDRVRTGTCSLTVAASGYIPQFRVITVDSAETTHVTVYLGGPHISVSPDTISYALRQGETAQTSIRISNIGSDTLRWNMTTARIGNPDTLYTNLLNVPITLRSHDGRINGIEIAWGKIWICGDNNLSNPNYFYRYNLDGSYVDSIPQPHGSLSFGFRDMEFDGQYLWGSDSQYLYGIDSTGTVRDSVVTSLSPARAIAIDPITHYFYIADQASSIQVLSRTGQVIRLIPNGLHIFGMTWFAEDPDSMPLYVLSQDSLPACLLSKMNPATGAHRPLKLLTNLNTQVGYGLAIANNWSYENRAILAVVRSVTADSAFGRVLNLGYVPRWFFPSRTSGVLSSGSIDSIVVQLSAVGAPVGNWNLQVQAHNNSPMPSASSVIQFQVSPATLVPERPTSVIPTTYTISELYPNPFNPSTSLHIALPSASPLTITIFDRIGRVSATIHRDRLAAGNYRFEIDGRQFASGLYFIRVQTNFGTSVKKGVLLK